MSNLNRHPVRRAAAGVLAGSLVLSGVALAAGISPANAVTGFDLKRLSGPDRYATAAAIALDGTTFDRSDTIVLASGETRNFPDALTGNYLAGSVRGPILLTRTASLPQSTRTAIVALNATKVVIVGGTSAVSAAVQAQVDDIDGISVTRVSGPDRYETARAVALKTADSNNSGTITAADTGTVGIDPQGVRTAVLGNGQNFPDILAAGPLGYAEQFPITITTPDTLKPSTQDVLQQLQIKRVLIVGGTTAVSQTVATQVSGLNGGIQVTRLSGPTRYQTAVAIADFEYDSLGFNDSHVNLARGDDFADALSGGPHAGEDVSPIVLTTPTPLDPSTKAFLQARACTLRNGHIFGGSAAVAFSTETEAEQAAGTPAGACAAGTAGSNVATPTGTINVRPDTAATQTATVNVTMSNGTSSDNTTSDDRLYSVNGLTAGVTYRITLVLCKNVQGSGGNATFKAVPAGSTTPPTTSSTGFVADASGVTADITRVDGVATTDTNTSNATFDSGSVIFTADDSTATFIVDGDSAPECVIPVVYVNGGPTSGDPNNTSPRLEVNGPANSFGAPVEQFDTGGQFNLL